LGRTAGGGEEGGFATGRGEEEGAGFLGEGGREEVEI